MAARRLAEMRQPAAVKVLAEAAITQQDEALRGMILDALTHIESQAEIDALIAVYLVSRHPCLENMIVSYGWVAGRPPAARVLSALKAGRLELVTQGRAELAASLLEMCDDRDAGVAQAARDCLLNLSGRYIIDAVCALWVEDRHPLLETAILQAGYTARSPDAVRILTCLKTGLLDGLDRSGLTDVIEIARCCADEDTQVSTNAQAIIAALEHPAAQQAACRQVLEGENQGLARAVVQGGFMPDDQTDRALFLFLTGQWEKYESLDFDSQRMRLVYENADRPVRERITRQVRSSGRSDFVKIIAGRDFQGRVERMSPTEFDILVQLLVDQAQFDRLWSLVFRLPLHWSQKAVLELAAQGWQPEALEDHSTFDRLKNLVDPEMPPTPIDFNTHLPLAVQRARTHLAQGRINAVAFSAQDTWLALGTSRRKAVVWDFHRAAAVTLIDGFEHSVGTLAFTPRGDLILGERSASAGEVCTAYHWSRSQARVVHQSRGSITCLAHIGDESALVAGRDGRIALIDLKDGFTISEKRLVDWPRAMCLAHSQSKAAFLSHGVQILSLPDMLLTARTSQWSQVAHSAGYLVDEKQIVVGKYNGEVVLLHENPLRLERKPLAEHKGWVEGIAVLRKQPLLVSAGAEGHILFTHLENRRQLAKLGRLGDRITSLQISPDEQFMAIGHADGTVSLWDLRVLDLPGLFEQPFELATPSHLAALLGLLQKEQFATMKEINGAAYNALVFSSLVLQHRFRFDIEIDAVPEIKFGDFEIEID